MIGKSLFDSGEIGNIIWVPLALCLGSPVTVGSWQLAQRGEVKGDHHASLLNNCRFFQVSYLGVLLMLLKKRLASSIVATSVRNLFLHYSEHCLSKAFSKSNFRITIFFFELWHKCKYSSDRARQSWVVLFLIKSYLFLWTSLVITVCNLFASSLVKSLTEELSREIGL